MATYINAFYCWGPSALLFSDGRPFWPIKEWWLQCLYYDPYGMAACWYHAHVCLRYVCRMAAACVIVLCTVVASCVLVYVIWYAVRDILRSGRCRVCVIVMFSRNDGCPSYEHRICLYYRISAMATWVWHVYNMRFFLYFSRTHIWIEVWFVRQLWPRMLFSLDVEFIFFFFL